MSSASVNLRIARDLGSSGWEKFKDYRDKKSQEAFEFLESAAKTADKSAEKHFPEARKEAGKLTKAAHARLDKSLEALQETGRDLIDGDAGETFEQVRDSASDNFSKATKKVQKQAKKLRKKADKQLSRKNRKRLSRAEKKANAAAKKVKDKAAKKLDKKNAKKAAKNLQKQASQATDNLPKSLKKTQKKAEKAAKQQAKKLQKAQKKVQKKTTSNSRGFGFYSLWAGVIAAIVGVIAYVLNKRKSGAPEEPPRASDYSSNTTSTLVYSSTSDDDLEAPNTDASAENAKAEKKAGDLAEDPAERDEELLADIDEQLSKNFSAGAAENLAASEATRASAHGDTDAAEKAAAIDEKLKEELKSDSDESATDEADSDEK